jgi:hypothetical protein
MYLSLEDEILLLREQVNYLLERVAEQPGSSERPVNWAALDVDEAAEQWSLLIGWVDWVTDRYQLDEWLPACWYAHGPLLEELSALRTAWVGAYLDPQARLDEPARWHELLDRTLDRIGTWDRTGCRDGTHHPDQPLPHGTDHSHRERAIRAQHQQVGRGWQGVQVVLRPGPGRDLEVRLGGVGLLLGRLDALARIRKVGTQPPASKLDTRSTAGLQQVVIAAHPLSKT